MNKAMFAGLSGTVAQQTKLDVIGNNIANAETVGFKQSRVTFSDTYYQTLLGGSSGSSSDTSLGGVNPQQIGTGVRIAGIETELDQGSLGSTGRPLDAAIEGPGMFVVTDGSRTSFTRDGSFSLDDQGTLVSPSTGMKVLGWQANRGVTDTSRPPAVMTFHVGEMRPGTATGSVVMGGNANSSAATGNAVNASIEVYDSLGNAHQVEITLTKTAVDNQWTCAASSGTDAATGTLTFGSTGALSSGSPLSLVLHPTGGAASPQSVALKFDSVTQLAATSDLLARSQDGNSPASLTEVSFGDGGTIEGKYADGSTETLGQIAVAAFANAEGLDRIGNNLYQTSAASGETQIGPASTGGRGRVVGQSLEQSNVDLTQSFVDMITTQRAFQASTRAISSADKLLEDVMQIIR